jgi:hypothetical protein
MEAMENREKPGLNRKIVTIVDEVIDRLYPEERYARAMFPDLYDVLRDLFFRNVQFPAQSSSSNDENVLREQALEILDFRNVLSKHTQAVVLIYRYNIRKFVKAKYTAKEEADDMVQEVLSRLLNKKMDRIREKYDFNYKKMPSFKSYLMVTVRNICIDIIRERNARLLTAGILDPIDDIMDAPGQNEMSRRLLIEEELNFFGTLLEMYYQVKPKLELCLKLKFRVPVKIEDLKRDFPYYDDDSVAVLTADYRLLKDKKMFVRVNDVFNRYEEKQKKSDSLRKWIDVKVDELVDHLNNSHRGPVYDLDKFADLVRFYYQ